MTIDTFSLSHWMNARKLTLEQLAQQSQVDSAIISNLLKGKPVESPDNELAEALASTLHVSSSQLTAVTPAHTVLTRTATELANTKRPIERDGIHFYNYYTLPAPIGSVGPVVLDILCPRERLPALNNGHLEPAITVNIGPGDINGRWGEEINETNWRVLEANTGEDQWICGTSYVEPSWCPHSYSLTSRTPARIVSYTAESNLASLTEKTNRWGEGPFSLYLDTLSEELPPGDIVDLLLARRSHTRHTIANAAGKDEAEINRALANPTEYLSTVQHIAATAGFDYRVALPAQSQADEVGKTWQSVDAARGSQRTFHGYTAASMASATDLGDVTGTFLRVEHEAEPETLHAHTRGALLDISQTHYLVTSGELELSWREEDGNEQSAILRTDHSAWIAPFVVHRLSGRGSAVRFGSGRPIGCQDLLELSSTFRSAMVAKRGRRDRSGWGYQ